MWTNWLLVRVNGYDQELLFKVTRVRVRVCILNP